MKSIEVEFQYLSATDSDQGRTVMTPELASIQWIANSLYPAGYYVRGIPVQATLTVPRGWQVATSLRPESGGGTSTITYKAVPYDVLVDSPALAGAHFRKMGAGARRHPQRRRRPARGAGRVRTRSSPPTASWSSRR